MEKQLFWPKQIGNSNKKEKCYPSTPDIQKESKSTVAISKTHRILSEQIPLIKY